MSDARNSLDALLEGLGESSQFVSWGSLPPVLPGLEVNDVGSVGSPISATDAQRLIGKATQAPYGRGEQTIVDTNIRRVWQIEPAEFRLENSEWDTQVAAIVNRVKEDFGIEQNQLDWFLTHVLADQRNYDLHQVLIPGVKSIYQWLAKVPEAHAAATTLLEHCRSELRAATAHTVEPPKDWAREAKLGCKCEDCQALSRFLRDPQARVGRFSIRKERRQHLHGQIDKHQCDCTHVTERKGSPQTLVCTKTQASYERRLQQYEIDQQLLAELDALASAKAAAPAAPHFKKAKRSSKK